MNAFTIVVAIILAVSVFLVILKLILDKKSCKKNRSSSCYSCNYYTSCHKKYKTK